MHPETKHPLHRRHVPICGVEKLGLKQIQKNLRSGCDWDPPVML